MWAWAWAVGCWQLYDCLPNVPKLIKIEINIGPLAKSIKQTNRARRPPMVNVSGDSFQMCARGHQQQRATWPCPKQQQLLQKNESVKVYEAKF